MEFSKDISPQMDKRISNLAEALSKSLSLEIEQVRERLRTAVAASRSKLKALEGETLVVRREVQMPIVEAAADRIISSTPVERQAVILYLLDELDRDPSMEVQKAVEAAENAFIENRKRNSKDLVEDSKSIDSDSAFMHDAGGGRRVIRSTKSFS
jgi:hypothetical protein